MLEQIVVISITLTNSLKDVKQISEIERLQIEQLYLDAYAIRDDLFADLIDFEQCVTQVNNLDLPKTVVSSAQQHDFNSYGETDWAPAFCDQVALNYLFLPRNLSLIARAIKGAMLPPIMISNVWPTTLLLDSVDPLIQQRINRPCSSVVGQSAGMLYNHTPRPALPIKL